MQHGCTAKQAGRGNLQKSTGQGDCNPARHLARRFAETRTRRRSCVPLLFDESVRNQSWNEMVSHIPLWHFPFVIAMAVTLLLGLGRRARGVFARSCNLGDAMALSNGTSLAERT